MSEYILEMNNIVKEFPGVKALDGVTIKVKEGEVHAIVGENGAGKSTLMKILSGLYPYGNYQGEVIINGQEMKFSSTKQSENAGIGIIYQELTLVKDLDVAENIFLGKLINKHGIVDWNEVYHRARELIEDIGFSIDVYRKIDSIGIGYQQLIEIAKALSVDANILILDEPSAALTVTEVSILMDTMRTLKGKGITCILISHKLNEVFEIADRVTILRDGKSIATHDIKELSEDKIINMMVGRELTERYPSVDKEIGEVMIEVQNLNKYSIDNNNKKILDDISFTARKGEILGISGLVGAGRTELITSIFGFFPGKQTGQIFIEGKPVEIKSPKDAIRCGMALLSENRKRYGLLLDQEISKNITISSLEKISNRGIISFDKENHISSEFSDKLTVKAPSVESIVKNLSGGNQQKVLLARCLMINPRILFLDEPTRGIDVGAKYEIYSLINQLAQEGVCIIMVSSEMPEIIGMSDRVLVISEGKITGEFTKEEATQEKIMEKASLNEGINKTVLTSGGLKNE